MEEELQKREQENMQFIDCISSGDIVQINTGLPIFTYVYENMGELMVRTNNKFFPDMSFKEILNNCKYIKVIGKIIDSVIDLNYDYCSVIYSSHAFDRSISRKSSGFLDQPSLKLKIAQIYYTRKEDEVLLEEYVKANEDFEKDEK